MVEEVLGEGLLNNGWWAVGGWLYRSEDSRCSLGMFWSSWRVPSAGSLRVHPEEFILKVTFDQRVSLQQLTKIAYDQSRRNLVNLGSFHSFLGVFDHRTHCGFGCMKYMSHPQV